MGEKLPKICAIVDVETTGLDPGKCSVIEVAVVTYDLAEMTILGSYSSLVYQADVVRHGNPAQGINGISPERLRGAPTQEQVWPEFLRRIVDAEVFVAHRASFDRSFFPKNVREALPWACTKFGVKWALGDYGGHLVDIYRAHAAYIYGNAAVERLVQRHRALGDCLMIVDLLEMSRDLGLDVRRAIAGATGVLEFNDPPPVQVWRNDMRGLAE